MSKNFWQIFGLQYPKLAFNLFKYGTLDFFYVENSIEIKRCKKNLNA